MERTAVCESGGGSRQTPNLLACGSWTSQPPELRESVSVVSQPAGQWYLVIAAQMDETDVHIYDLSVEMRWLTCRIPRGSI